MIGLLFKVEVEAAAAVVDLEEALAEVAEVAVDSVVASVDVEVAVEAVAAVVVEDFEEVLAAAVAVAVVVVDSEAVAAVVSAAADNLIRPFYIFHMYIIISNCCFMNRYTLFNKIKFSPQNFVFFFSFFIAGFLVEELKTKKQKHILLKSLKQSLKQQNLKE